MLPLPYHRPPEQWAIIRSATPLVLTRFLDRLQMSTRQALFEACNTAAGPGGDYPDPTANRQAASLLLLHSDLLVLRATPPKAQPQRPHALLLNATRNDRQYPQAVADALSEVLTIARTLFDFNHDSLLAKAYIDHALRSDPANLFGVSLQELQEAYQQAVRKIRSQHTIYGLQQNIPTALLPPRASVKRPQGDRRGWPDARLDQTAGLSAMTDVADSYRAGSVFILSGDKAL